MRPLPFLAALIALATSPLAAAAQAPTYWIYVAAESADLLHRIRFGPDGAAVENTIVVGELPDEADGPHGLRFSPDGRYLYLTTGHGLPTGKLWKLEAGPDTLVAEPILLGRFPATVDLTPDGLYAFVVNFNLHGAHLPSTVSTVYTPDLVEVAQTTTCTMPHGLRVRPDGLAAYSACMMDDRLVELDTRTLAVTRQFSVAHGSEGPFADPMGGAMDDEMVAPSCSPTWAQPSSDGAYVYMACNAGDEILEISTAEWQLARRWAVGRGPYNLEVTTDGSLLVFTLKQGAGVQAIELTTGELTAPVPTSGPVAHGVVVSPDGRYAFVSVEDIGMTPGKVDIYELATLERVTTVDVGAQAGGIAFWRMEPAP